MNLIVQFCSRSYPTGGGPPNADHYGRYGGNYGGARGYPPPAGGAPVGPPPAPPQSPTPPPAASQEYYRPPGATAPPPPPHLQHDVRFPAFSLIIFMINIYFRFLYNFCNSSNINYGNNNSLISETSFMQMHVQCFCLFSLFLFALHMICEFFHIQFIRDIFNYIIETIHMNSSSSTKFL